MYNPLLASDRDPSQFRDQMRKKNNILKKILPPHLVLWSWTGYYFLIKVLFRKKKKLLKICPFSRSNDFKEDDAVWRGGEDGGVGGGGPPPAQMGGMGPQGGYVAK